MTGVQTCALPDRKSTRLNSSHTIISYAVFCLKQQRTHAGAAADPPARARLRPARPPRPRSPPARGPGVERERLGPPRRVPLDVFFFLMVGPPPGSPLFPSRALFRL